MYKLTLGVINIEDIKKDVILFTDGDKSAQKAVKIAAYNVNASYVIAFSEIIGTYDLHYIYNEIKNSTKDPVIVLIDDKGEKGVGEGENVIYHILNNNDFNVLGIVAVSSDGKDCNKIQLAESITKGGKVINGVVDKAGNEVQSDLICGDTLSILKNLKNVVMIGLGDPGKMDYCDDEIKGAPITTKAIQEVIAKAATHLDPHP